MSVDAAVLGFSNRWYAEVVAMAQWVRLANGFEIRVVSASVFVATKLEAFVSRGCGDFLSSHDLEDVLNVVDGRPELSEELVRASATLQQAVGKTFNGLLANPDFINCLPDLIADVDRVGVVIERLRRMATDS